MTPVQIAFIIVASVVVLVGLVLLYFLVIRKKLIAKRYRNFYYKSVYHIAEEKDYYLINNLYFKLDDRKHARIDHVLFGNKYIYLINCYYYEGDLKGSLEDHSLVLIPKNAKKRYVKNPYQTSKITLERLVRRSFLDEDLFIGIVVTNENINLEIISNSKQYYFVQRNKLHQLIKAIESRDVGEIQPDELNNLVQALYKNSNKIKSRL